MKKTTLSEIVATFKNYNRQNGIEYGDPKRVDDITAVIVYKQSNFTKPYSEESRSYRINNRCGKAFFDLPSLSKSMWGDSLDRTDLDVRLDVCGWDIEYCYFEE